MPPGGLLAGSWEALGQLLEASKKHHGPKIGIVTIFEGFLEKMKFWGSILATFEHPKSEFWGFQEGIQDRADYEGVWASILERFSKAWEGQKLTSLQLLLKMHGCLHLGPFFTHFGSQIGSNFKALGIHFQPLFLAKTFLKG